MSERVTVKTDNTFAAWMLGICIYLGLHDLAEAVRGKPTPTYEFSGCSDAD
jgi:hypothetical protein